MSANSNFVLTHDIDEMDIIMSQINTSEIEKNEKNQLNEMPAAMDQNLSQINTETDSSVQPDFEYEALDEMDAIISQIDTDGMKYEADQLVQPDDEALDEMDAIISQIDTEGMGQEIDDIGLPQELLDQYDEAVEDIDDELVKQVSNEADVEEEVPADLLEEYNKAMDDILPTKSGNRYLQAYQVFRKWQASYRTESFNEKLVLAYFGLASKTYKPPTLWSMYSMLKKTFLCKHNVDLSKHCRLRAFLKKQSDGYEGKKANIFEAEEILKFFVEAPNDTYLGMKVVMIFGLTGACRGCELTNLTLSNVQDDGKEVIVKIPKTKTKTPKLYVVGDELAKMIRQYLKMRPSNVSTNRLFYQWRKGKCVNQVMGKHSIAKIPKEVAKFLDLPDPMSFTGHSYRRTGTTLAANAGFSMLELKRFGGWKSDSVCEGYIQNSLAYKRGQAKRISDVIRLPETSGASSHVPANALDDIVFGEIESTNVPGSSGKSSIECVESSAISGVASMMAPTSSTISAQNEQHKDVQPMSVNFASPSEFTLSGPGTSLTISGVGEKSSLESAQGKDRHIIFHFGGTTSVTVINMK